MTLSAVRSRVQLTFRQTGVHAPPSFCKRRMRTSVGPGLSFVAALRECMRLRLRPTIHRNTCPGDPPSTIGGEESDHLGDIIGFTDSLERLHVECKIAARFLGTTGFTRMPCGPNGEARCFTRDRSVAATRNGFRGEQRRVAAVVITQPRERLCDPAAVHG